MDKGGLFPARLRLFLSSPPRPCLGTGHLTYVFVKKDCSQLPTDFYDIYTHIYVLSFLLSFLDCFHFLREREGYEIIVLCVRACVRAPFQLLNQLTDIHEIRYDHCA